MTDLGGRELLREWRKLMDSVVDSAASVAGRGEVPQKLLKAMQHQLQLVEAVIEREQGVCRGTWRLGLSPPSMPSSISSRRAGPRCGARRRLSSRRDVRWRRLRH